MKAVATLLARKQQLLARLQENPGPHERDEIDRLMAQINRALDDIERSVVGRPQQRAQGVSL